jgi:hypothetical protein
MQLQFQRTASSQAIHVAMADINKKHDKCAEALQAAIDCEQLAATAEKNARDAQKATEQKLGAQTVMKRALASVAIGVFSSIEHVKRCKKAHQFVASIGGAEKIKEINDKYEMIMNKKMDPELLEYTEVVEGIGAYLGAITCMTWHDCSNSLVSFAEQPKLASMKSTDIHFEILASPARASARSFITVPLVTVKAHSTIVNGPNVQSVFDGFCTDANIRKLYNSYNSLVKAASCISFESYSRVVIQQTRDAIEAQPGLKGLLKPCASDLISGVPMAELIQTTRDKPHLNAQIQDVVQNKDMSEPAKMEAIRRIVREGPPMSNKEGKRPIQTSALYSLADAAASRTASADSDDEPSVVSVKSREQRDAEGRANAIVIE